MASKKQGEEDNGRGRTGVQTESTSEEHGDESSGLTENGVDLVGVEGAALRLEGGSAASPAAQVAVHQRVHVEHAHQQRPGHRRGRLRLIGRLPGAHVTENTGAGVHLHLAHLDGR